MVTEIGYEQLKHLVNKGAQLVEVLPEPEFLEEHLVGAINLPLTEISSTLGGLDRSRPVIVYCFDYQWDLSPRAACRLEALGFREVYDFAVGKAGWTANGLPTEGTNTSQRIGENVESVPTCGLHEDLRDVARRVRYVGGDMAVVVDRDKVVLGVLREDALSSKDPEAIVQSEMTEGPSSYRPDVSVEHIERLMEEKDFHNTIVTTAEGVLVGVYRKQDDRSARDPSARLKLSTR